MNGWLFAGAGFLAGATTIYALLSIRLGRLGERAVQSELLNQKLQNEFKLAASEALRVANEQFLSSAIKDLRQVKTEADESLHLKNQEIAASFKEVREKIDGYQDRLRKFEDERGSLYTKMESALKQVLDAENSVRSETAGLKRVLTTSSGVRGQWGEKVLLEILEQSNLVRGIHFETQVSFSAEGENDARPDFIIHRPGGKRLIIDSKEVASEYVLAQEEDDVDRQKEHYQKLVQNIRSNFIRLSRKEYQSFLDEDVRYVVMFIPSESAIRAAFATDPGIFDEASQRKVIIASPMTIMPLIYLVANSWQQHRLANNARELGTVVEELGERLFKFIGYLKNIRDGIEKTADSWNKAVGSWEKRVSPQIDRVKNLGGRLRETEELSSVHPDLRRSPETASEPEKQILIGE